MRKVERVILVQNSVTKVAIVAQVAIGSLLRKHLCVFSLTCHIVEQVARAHHGSTCLKLEVRQLAILGDSLASVLAKPDVIALRPKEGNLLRIGLAKGGACLRAAITRYNQLLTRDTLINLVATYGKCQCCQYYKNLLHNLFVFRVSSKHYISSQGEGNC